MGLERQRRWTIELTIQTIDLTIETIATIQTIQIEATDTIQ